MLLLTVLFVVLPNRLGLHGLSLEVMQFLIAIIMLVTGIWILIGLMKILKINGKNMRKDDKVLLAVSILLIIFGFIVATGNTAWSEA
jgi:uncharacterized membrane protein YozB (DUF420 family)